MWHVAFDARWQLEQSIGAQAQECWFELHDAAGELIVHRDFGLHVGDGQDEVVAPVDVQAAELGDTDPEEIAVTVRC